MSDVPELTLFYFPRACSLAVHIALEESGLAYRRRLIDLRTAENQKADYLTLNPTGAIPALSLGTDAVLTETHAILTYIGDRAADRKLLPEVGTPARYQAHQWMNFLSSSVHTYIRSIFRPSAYGGDDTSVNDGIRAQGEINLAKAVGAVEQRLDRYDWALGDTFSVVDGYLFLMYLWSMDARIATVPDRPNWKALATRVWQRPAVKTVVAIEQQDRNFEIPLELDLIGGENL
jgi:glutathione S-transferase